jgi:hypothetical protein
MRVQFIHKNLGISMWVTETEVEKYKAAGHKLAATSEPAKEVKVEVETPKEEPKKAKVTKTKK